MLIFNKVHLKETDLFVDLKRETITYYKLHEVLLEMNFNLHFC